MEDRINRDNIMREILFLIFILLSDYGLLHTLHGISGEVAYYGLIIAILNIVFGMCIVFTMDNNRDL